MRGTTRYNHNYNTPGLELVVARWISNVVWTGELLPAVYVIIA